MWTARAPVGFGPRPYSPDNIIAIDYFENYPEAEKLLILDAYKTRGYQSGVMGPIVDPGYHGQLPSVDWRADISPYLDGAERLERNGIKVVHFVRPDRDVAGLAWTVEDLKRELSAQFSTPRAQTLMHTVCLGWEPGPRYYYTNAWWTEMVQWLEWQFPNALRLIHMVADSDAPAGGDDDKIPGFTNGVAWQNVAPHLHGWLVQNAGYTGGSSPQPSAQFVADFTNQFRVDVRGSLIERFTTGGPTGDWPISSAWGTGQRLRVYAGEYAAFQNYWSNWPEDQSQYLGSQALLAGADGYLDGGIG